MWKSFVVFVDQLVPQNFSSEIACAVALGHERLLSNRKNFLMNYNLVLQLQNFSTWNDLQYTACSYLLCKPCHTIAT